MISVNQIIANGNKSHLPNEEIEKRNEKNKEVVNIPNNKKILLLMPLFKYNR